MCTLSFVPDVDGYFVAMNRDELKDRVAAHPPVPHQGDRLSLLYPSEPTGGTWIGANSHGNLLALLNWNGVRNAEAYAKQKSRGELIPRLLSLVDVYQTDSAIQDMALQGFLPFGLIAVFCKERQLREWRWDGARLTDHVQPWTRAHWFSSSLSDQRAEAQRGHVLEHLWHEGITDTAQWLRSVHASHIPEAGPYSICVHRPDAATVSFTAVRCSSDQLEMTYFAGQPCQLEPRSVSVQLPLAIPGA